MGITSPSGSSHHSSCEAFHSASTTRRCTQWLAGWSQLPSSCCHVKSGSARASQSLLHLHAGSTAENARTAARRALFMVAAMCKAETTYLGSAQPVDERPGEGISSDEHPVRAHSSAGRAADF